MRLDRVYWQRRLRYSVCRISDRGDTDRSLYVTRGGRKIPANHQLVFHDNGKGAVTSTVVSDSRIRRLIGSQRTRKDDDVPESINGPCEDRRCQDSQFGLHCRITLKRDPFVSLTHKVIVQEGCRTPESLRIELRVFPRKKIPEQGCTHVAIQ